jgi:integrase
MRLSPLGERHVKGGVKGDRCGGGTESGTNPSSSTISSSQLASNFCRRSRRFSSRASITFSRRTRYSQRAGGEIRGLRWEDYAPGVSGSMATLRVNRSIWNGIETEPKTAKSKAPVPVIAPVAVQLESYRQQCGNPTSGAMFKNSIGRPLDLKELYRRVMKDIFAFKRVQWHGWHAFRRGLATNLKHLGIDDKIMQAILRHSNISTTQNVYIKELPVDVVAAMKRLGTAFASKQKPVVGAA